MPAQAFPNNPHEDGWPNVRSIVFNSGNIGFGGATLFGQLRLRQAFFFAKLLQHRSQLKGFEAFFKFFTDGSAALAVLPVKMVAELGEVVRRLESLLAHYRHLLKLVRYASIWKIQCLPNLRLLPV